MAFKKQKQGVFYIDAVKRNTGGFLPHILVDQVQCRITLVFFYIIEKTQFVAGIGKIHVSRVGIPGRTISVLQKDPFMDDI